ncbi:MAG TPA: hypothetical protein VLB12_09145 [Gemmatimonadales bacterium]|nr:hypothetical protein [Gemmatimonadales bacterium]
MPIAILTRVELDAADTGGQTSTVGETSVAKSGDRVFVTGNWYAARTDDLGATWVPVDPFTVLPPADAGFCCDQTAIHVPGHDLFVWLLQYVKLNGSNTLRVAVKRAGTLGDDRWSYWDLRPETTNDQWTEEWFDFNHAALSDNFLYVSTNVYTASENQWRRAVVFRLPLAVLASEGELTFEYFMTTDNGTLRCTQGARDVMYFGSHNSQTQIRLFSWPESSTEVDTTDIDVSRWNGGSYSAPGPDTRNWLGRCDGRMTGGWVGDGVIGFMWSANALGAVRPRPYVRVVRIAEPTRGLLDEPDIWHANIAYAYPDAATNDSGEVGLSLFRGGGPVFPGHVVGAWDAGSGAWELAASRTGTHAPNDGKWGDYVTCRRDAPDADQWVAVGFTLQGGGARTDIEPILVQFRR